MSLLAFYSRNSQEVLGLVGQHLYLVAISTGAAIVIGVPLGVLLTRRPALAGPRAGVANVFQTVPSLALFGFLIPLPFIGRHRRDDRHRRARAVRAPPHRSQHLRGDRRRGPAVREAGRAWA